MRELGGEVIYHKWSETAIGFKLEGKFVRTGTDNYGKTSWVIRAEDGQEHVLNNCASLTWKFRYAKIGQVLLLTYKGTETRKTKDYGVKKVHKFKLFCTSDEAASVDDMDEEDGDTDDTDDTDLIDVLDFGDEDEDDDSLSLDILDA